MIAGVQVRVCDSCFDKYGPKEGAVVAGGSISPLPPAQPGGKETDLPAEYLASPLSKQSQVPIWPRHLIGVSIGKI